jgi:signal transduction histidine kinase
MLKLFEINSIRGRMVTGFLFLTLLILILALVSLSIIDSITKVARMDSNISQLEIYTLSLIKCDNDYFDLETINENYFKTRQSSFLEKHDSLNKRIFIKIEKLNEEVRNKNRGVDKSITDIDSTLSLYNTKFRTLEGLVFRKGFKDYGVEGAMRFHAHALEGTVSGTAMSSLLYLRRHEKDFLLRSDTTYVRAFKRRVVQLFQELQKAPVSNKEAIRHLQEYQRLFVELVEIQLQLGLTSTHGLRNELNNLTNLLSDKYYSLSEHSYAQAEMAYYNLRTLYVTLLCGAILFSIVSGYWISKRLSDPIARLSKLIHESISEKDAARADLRTPNGAIEINILAGSFMLLLNQTRTQLSKIKIKSRLLRQKNKELKKLNRELDNFLYSTAHDLQSPLSSLLGLVNVIRYENKQPELTPYFDMMEKSINQSEDFISQIVSFSKNKNTEILPEKLELVEIITAIFDHHQFIEGASKIKKVLTVNDPVPFYSDRNRITIIFNNLISNAIKYADFGKDQPLIRLLVTINPEEALIEFTDNGIGIDEEHVGNIFEMFYRANTNSKGSGLGLFIFRETIRRMKGQATVESRIDQGTKFFIRLPNLPDPVLIQQQLELSA